MLNIKSSFALSVLALSLTMVGCGGSSDSNSNYQANNNANNGGNTDHPQASYDIMQQTDNNGFYIETQNSGAGFKEFAVLYGADAKIAYQTKGYHGLDQADETSLILTKNKLLTEDETDQLFSSQAGQYVVGDKNGHYKTTFKYKISDISGHKILSDRFLVYLGFPQETLGVFDNSIQKITDFMSIAAAHKDVFASGTECAVITHIEYNQPAIQFYTDDYDDDVGLSEWVSYHKKQGKTVITDNYAGYQVAYISSASLENEAVIEYDGKLHYGEYMSSSVLDIKQALEKEIKAHEEALKGPNGQSEGLKETLELLKADLTAFNEGTHCMIYNKKATDQILNTFRTIPSL